MNKLAKIDWRTLSRSFVLLVIITYFYLFASAQHSFLNPAVQTISAILFSFMLIGIVLIKSSQDKYLNLAIAGFYLALIITSFTSIDPQRSLMEVWLLLIPCLLFFFTRALISSGWQPELFVRMLLVFGVIFMSFSWVEAGSWYTAWLRENPGQWFPEIAYRLPAPNFISVLLNVWLMLAIAQFFAAKHKGIKAVLILWMVSAFGLIYLTSSRGGWLGTVAGIGTMFLISLFRFKVYWKTIADKWLKKTWVRIGVGLGILGFAAGFIELLVIQSRHPSHGSIFHSRDIFWQPAWYYFKQSPILGYGPHTFVSLFVQYNPVPPQFIYDYAHSIYLDILTGSGMIGLIAFIVMVIVAGFALYKRIKNNTGPSLAIVFGVVGALTAFLVHGLFDSVHHTVPTSVWNLAIILGIGFGINREAKPEIVNFNKLVHKLIPVIVAVLVVVGAWINLWQLIPQAEGVKAAESGDWQYAKTQFEIAADRNWGNAITLQQLGMVYANLAESENNPAYLDKAIRTYQQVIDIDPYWALNYANLGWLYDASGDVLQAEKAFSEAVTLSPKSADFQLGYGMASEQTGNLSQADSAYRRALAINPDLSGLELWTESVFRAQLLEEWLQENPAIEKDETDLLEALTIQNGRTYLDLAEYYLTEGRVSEAEAYLEQAQFANFRSNTDRITLKWLQAAAAEAKGDLNLAQDLRNQVEAAYDNPGIYGPGTLGNPAYAIYNFRRPVIFRDYVPQMGMMGVLDISLKLGNENLIWINHQKLK